MKHWNVLTLSIINRTPSNISYLSPKLFNFAWLSSVLWSLWRIDKFVLSKCWTSLIVNKSNQSWLFYKISGYLGGYFMVSGSKSFLLGKEGKTFYVNNQETKSKCKNVKIRVRFACNFPIGSCIRIRYPFSAVVQSPSLSSCGLAPGVSWRYSVRRVRAFVETNDH